MWKAIKDQQGMVVVEAIVIMPIAILSVILLIYISLFFCQRANLQAALETSVVYFKNTITDTYLYTDNEMLYVTGKSVVDGKGNSYSATEPLNPYRGIFTAGPSELNQKAFEKFFRSVAGNLLMGDDVDVTFTKHNYVLFHELEVTAVQHVKLPLDFSILGITSNSYEIRAAARVAVVDHDDLIRNTDYAIDLLEDTKIGEYARKLATSVAELYDRLKNFLS